jgi:hypothetical protein
VIDSDQIGNWRRYTKLHTQLYPYLRADRETKDLEQVCRENGARVVGTGVNPGFVLDVLPELKKL